MSEKFRNLFKRKLKYFSNSFSIEYQSYRGEVLNETTRRLFTASDWLAVMTVCVSVGLITDTMSVNINVSVSKMPG